MKIYRSFAIAAAAVFALSPLAIPNVARAEVMVQGLAGSLCMQAEGGKLYLKTCNGSPAQNWFIGAYGQQIYNGQCMEGSNGNLTMTTCRNTPDQRWQLQRDGQLNNEGGWCADVPFGANFWSQTFGVGTHKCNGGKNQKWARGEFRRNEATGVMSGSKAGEIFYGGGVIGVTGTPLVAQGGGNLVAQGGGNLVAQGGGNLIIINGGALVAQGGGNRPR